MNVPEGAGMIDQGYLHKQLAAICQIQIPSKKGKATGFVGHLQYQHKDLYLLITSHHVLQKRRDQPSGIEITFRGDNKLKGDELFSSDSRWFTDNGTNLQDNTKYGLDYTMIEVRKEKLDELKITPFDLTHTKLGEMDQLMVASHPVQDNEQKPLHLSFHRCKTILGLFVYYGCATCKGSSGSPVLKVVDEKLRVVALHRGNLQEKCLNYGSLFSAILNHATYSEVPPETTVLMVKKFEEKVKWKSLEMADLLQLLQPVESSWKTLAGYLLRDDQQHKVETIESDCFHDNTSKSALEKVLGEWLQCTVRAKRNWQTLCDAAKKYGDDSLENYLKENYLEKNSEPTMKLLQRWSKNSSLRTSSDNWYNFAVKLIGKTKTDIIRNDLSGGGNHVCLQKMLGFWYDSTPDHNWQIIIDALTEMDRFPCIESIESHCLGYM